MDSVRRFECKEEEEQQGERRGGKAREHEKVPRGGMEEDEEPEERTRVLSLPVHILGHHERVFAIAGGSWWGASAQPSEAPAGRLRLSGPFLDDVGDNTADGPVGAPEIPTRTGRNARLKVGSTTDSRVPTNARDHVQQGRAVTSPYDLSFFLPILFLPSPFHRVPSSRLLCLSCFLFVLQPRLLLIPPHDPGYLLVRFHLSFSSS